MLIGSYLHNIDKKGRVFVPAKFREDLGERFVVSKSLDGQRCLTVYAIEEWDKLSKKISELPYLAANKLKRFLNSGAAEAVPDAQGRILVPQSLREYADLSGEAYIIGASNTVEIWNKNEWEKQQESVTGENIAELMETLDF